MTNKQVQLLLQYLGFYAGKIDGKIGNQSRKAIREFQAAFGMPQNGIADEATQKNLRHAVCYGLPELEGDFWEGIRYFSRSEFRCKCGKCGGFPEEPDEELVKLLETIREHFGAPVTVTSGVRCEVHNSAVGGASRSQHLYGTAADIKVKGIAPEAVAAYAEELLPGTGGIGRYGSFTHVDVRKNKSRWKG